MTHKPTQLPDDKMTHILTQVENYYDSWWQIQNFYATWATQHQTYPRALFTLYQLSKHPDGCSQAWLGEKLALPKQTLSSILSKMEADQLISREILPADRRNKLIHLTPAGQVRAKELLQMLQATELQIFAQMPVAELDSIVTAFAALVQAQSTHL